MIHKVVLSNGRTVILHEGRQSLSIGLADGTGEDVDAWICEINAGGVLVMPNSGDATQCLAESLTD